MTEFFAEMEEYNRREISLEPINKIDGLPIVVRIENGGDFDNWSGGLYPAEIQMVQNEDGSMKTMYLYEQFTYIFKVTSLPEFISQQETEASTLQTECVVGDEVYLKFYQGKIGDFLVCCKFEEHE